MFLPHGLAPCGKANPWTERNSVCTEGQHCTSDSKGVFHQTYLGQDGNVHLFLQKQKISPTRADSVLAPPWCTLPGLSRTLRAVYVLRSRQTTFSRLMRVERTHLQRFRGLNQHSDALHLVQKS